MMEAASATKFLNSITQFFMWLINFRLFLALFHDLTKPSIPEDFYFKYLTGNNFFKWANPGLF